MSRPFGYGHTPDGWEPAKLRSVLTRRKRTGQVGLPLLSVNLPEGVVMRRTGDGRAAPSTDLSAYQEVRPGDLVMNQLGKPHGALGVSGFHGIISPAYFIAELSDRIHPRFAHHLLRTRLYISEYERRGKFMPPSQFDISWDQFREIDLALPPPEVQRAIADYLDAETAHIEALITKKRRMIDLLEEGWRSLRASRVIGSSFDPVTGLGDRPTDAEAILNLGVLIELQRGHDLPADSRENGPVPIVSSGGVSGYHNVSAASGPGVVTGRYGTIGEVYYVEQDYWPLNTTLYVKDFRGNDPRWIAHMLATVPLDAEKDKSAVTGINRNVIGQLRIPRPSVNDQVTIGIELDERRSRSEATITKLTTQIDLLGERRQALITAAVTGELEIPGVAA